MRPAPYGGAAWSSDGLDERLNRYALDRLSPGQEVLDGRRAAILAAYAERARASAAPQRRSGLRRWSLAGAFALLLLAAGSLVAAESGPGEPFYGLRLAIGSITLPGEEPAHERALAGQLDDRLSEAGAAARNGDGRAAQAAISEYLHTLSELTSNGIDDPDVLNLLRRHQDTLQDLLSVAPAQATGGVQQAIDEAGKVGDSIPHPTPPPGAGETPPDTGRP